MRRQWLPPQNHFFPAGKFFRQCWTNYNNVFPIYVLTRASTLFEAIDLPRVLFYRCMSVTKNTKLFVCEVRCIPRTAPSALPGLDGRPKVRHGCSNNYFMDTPIESLLDGYFPLFYDFLSKHSRIGSFRTSLASPQIKNLFFAFCKTIKVVTFH